MHCLKSIAVPGKRTQATMLNDLNFTVKMGQLGSRGTFSAGKTTTTGWRMVEIDLNWIPFSIFVS